VHRPQLLIGPLALGAILVGSLALVVDPGAVPPSSASLIAVGLAIVGVTGLAGLLLARAPWARIVLVGGVIAAMALASVGSSPITWVTLAVGGCALVGLLGPWLTLWIRHHRLTDAPGPVVVVLESVAAGAALFVGVATIGTGARWYHWALAVLCIGSSVAYGRGSLAGRVLLRTAVPLAACSVAIAMADLGGVAIAVAGVGIGGAAWTRAATRTATVIAPVLPTPVARGGDR
jgi:hypothetical protein